ncbi:MAG: hypothetical protein M1814_005442 [Vezdaea aestivalis]|nr:MAG: hypothetical protein M1814_005442 [Vezdaea aestivalis]
MDQLPSEVILRVLSFLDADSIKEFQCVSRRCLEVGRDNLFWRTRCYQTSFAGSRGPSSVFPSLSVAFSNLDHIYEVNSSRDDAVKSKAHKDVGSVFTASPANWDPSFKYEETDWYQEYIHRNARISFQWFSDSLSSRHEQDRKAKGMALLQEYPNGNGDPLVVTSTYDGTVELWILPSSGSNSDTYREAPKIIYATDKCFLFKSTNSAYRATPLADHIRIDAKNRIAYFAFERSLIEIDLNTMQVTSQREFDPSICGISEANGDVPLSVSTRSGLHLIDRRDPSLGFMALEGALPLSLQLQFSQGDATCIHHPLSSSSGRSEHDIFVSGRFGSILFYDRRRLICPRQAFHSGAQINCLSSFPYPLNSVDSSPEHWPVDKIVSYSSTSKAHLLPRNIILTASGSFRGRGSLETYNLQKSGVAQVINRQSAATATILSHTYHGTRLVYSDADGKIYWKERDARASVRSISINSHRPSTLTPEDPGCQMALKIQAVDQPGLPFNSNDLLAWTGSRIAQITFKSPRNVETEATIEEGSEQEDHEGAQRYDAAMRRALETHSAQANFLQNLGAI